MRRKSKYQLSVSR